MFLHADSEDSNQDLFYRLLADAQADLSFRWAHMSFCWFCCAVAHIQSFNEDHKNHCLSSKHQFP